jgi:hypothetical protein
MRAQLPSDWETYLSRGSGQTYYYNTTTGESTYAHPAGQSAATLALPPAHGGVAEPHASFLQQGEAEEGCAICLRPLHPGGDGLSCGHRFHLQCLAAWTLSAADNHSACPTCRQEIVDPAEVRAHQVCAQCGCSMSHLCDTLLYGPESAKLYCLPCRGEAFLGAIKARINGIYADHNPRKLDDTDGLLEEWKGEEDVLLANVEAKYGLVGETPTIRAKMFCIYVESNPRKLGTHGLTAETHTPYPDTLSHRLVRAAAQALVALSRICASSEEGGSPDILGT